MKNNPKSGTRSELAEFLRERRREVLVPPKEGRGNYRPGLSQKDLAERIGLHARHLRRIEVGQAVATDQILQLMSDALALTDLYRVQLWRLALNREPPPSFLVDSPHLNSYWRWLVPRIESSTTILGDHLVIGPAVGVVRLDSKHLAYNKEYRNLFAGGHPPEYLFKWLAHDGVSQLPDHPDVWLPEILPDLRAQLAVFPDDEGLLELKRWCEETPSLAAAWADAKPFFSSPDGGIFPFVHPIHGKGAFEVGVLTSDAKEGPGLRFFVTHFHVGVNPDVVQKLRSESGQR